MHTYSDNFIYLSLDGGKAKQDEFKYRTHCTSAARSGGGNCDVLNNRPSVPISSALAMNNGKPRIPSFEFEHVAYISYDVDHGKPTAKLNYVMSPSQSGRAENVLRENSCESQYSLDPYQSPKISARGSASPPSVSSPTADRASHGLFTHPITTIMLRNIPNKYTKQALLEEFSVHGFSEGDAVDFFYLPIDLTSAVNMGYAFINFVSVAQQEAFSTTFEGRCLARYNSKKILRVFPASLQGVEANWKHYSRTMVMSHTDVECRPWFYQMQEPASNAHWKTATTGYLRKTRRTRRGSLGSKTSCGTANLGATSINARALPTDHDLISPGDEAPVEVASHVLGNSTIGSIRMCDNCRIIRPGNEKFCSQCGIKFATC
eukprot:GEMP01037718.1.p1 GENE.GEMP01037718.1~~GEMP01037718.1.p1  ORF type:complete len:376 (-),score=60.77 GEMP01037718.1:580-1707(-)